MSAGSSQTIDRAPRAGPSTWAYARLREVPLDPGQATQRLMNARELDRSIRRLAQEITERLGDPSAFALVGIVRGGAALAERLAQAIERQEGARPETGSLDITLYRDDLYTGIEKPVLGETRLPGRVGGRTLVLVDDVLFTGRTVRAALDEIMDYGRPKLIQLAVLVDRGHRELPIAADYVGRKLETQKTDRVTVHFVEDGSPEDGVQICTTVREGGR